MTLPYLTALGVVALVSTSGGGARFLERMPINASSWASQSIAFSTNTTFSGALRANRSLAKSLLPTTTRRPRRAPFVVSRVSGVTSSATRRDRRLSRLNARERSEERRVGKEWRCGRRGCQEQETRWTRVAG